jgi:hypothetical protein
MAQVPGNRDSIDGKKMLPRLALGCLLFSLIMSAGVYLFAQATSPFFQQQAKSKSGR